MLQHDIQMKILTKYALLVKEKWHYLKFLVLCLNVKQNYGLHILYCQRYKKKFYGKADKRKKIE